MPGNQQSIVYNYLPENSFAVYVDSVLVGGFSKATGLYKATVDNIVHREGGSLTETDKQPGNVTFDGVTLEQGASTNRVLGEWFDDIIANGGTSGQNNPKYRRQVRIAQLDRDKTTVIMSYTYNEAFITEYDEGNFDATSSNFRMNVVKFEYVGKPTVKIGP